MISVIICSANDEMSRRCAENIRQTIGAEFELLITDNRTNNWPITKVYNDAALRAKYDLLCFVHEDVLFYIQDWGKALAKVLSDKQIGMAGLCGGIYKSKVPAAWIDIPRSYRRANMKARNEQGELYDYINKTSETESTSRVVTLDGFCLMMKKDIWEEFKFDEQNLKGFHYYDLDMSLRIGSKYNLVVSHDISAEHLSPGNFGSEWVDETLKFHKRFRKHLPVYTGVDDEKERAFLESFSMKRFLEKCRQAKRLNLQLLAYLLWNYPMVTLKNLTFLLRLISN
jgi:hypothetical protein